MNAEQEAIALVPPAAFGSGEVTAPQKVAVSAGTASALVTIPAGVGWITVTSDVDMGMRYGSAATIADGSASDWPAWGKTYQNFWLGKLDQATSIKFFGGSASGTAWVYASSK
jgi:hypothetical protein